MSSSQNEGDSGVIIPDQCFHAIDVDDAAYGFGAELLPLTDIPPVRIRVGVGMVGKDVVPDGIPGGDGVCPLERN